MGPPDLEGAAQHGEVEVPLAGEVVVQQAAGDPRHLCQGVDREIVEAPDRELLHAEVRRRSLVLP